jgi:hypothetical protein
MTDEVNEHVEHLRLDMFDRAGPAELELLGVDDTIGELVDRALDGTPPIGSPAVLFGSAAAGT